jgi:predicted unusual protein kinase regulating ubiquinone biosynthesis (AarF/ABC1/UbiB family)
MIVQPTQTDVSSRPEVVKVDRRRYRKVVRFFAGMFLNVIWWEMILRRIIGRKAVSRGRSERLLRYAQRFRQLAVDMGGVMIKLGQFLSARIDVMPSEITDVLADLQDEVPAEPLDAMLAVIEEELGAPADDIFAVFNHEVEAAASLGQVYRARLQSGEAVAVKVQRPDIECVVATDLAALRIAARWAMRWKLIRERADVPALLEEFARTLWEEIDYIAEAENARRFRELFADDVRVYVPSVHDKYSTRRVLTLEDVTSIKITDLEAIEATGIDRAVAARRLLDIYLKMIFEFSFFHADPHPGNLFVYPLSEEAAAEMYNGEPLHAGRPFYIVFVDFGMVGRIAPNVREGLQEALIAVVTRDTGRLLDSYEKLGVLLPSADLDRIREAETDMLDTMWGKNISEITDMPREEMHRFAEQYADLMYELPFQVPQDFIYLGRAIGILSGMCTMLDPEFNPWQPVIRYAEKLIRSESGRGIQSIATEAVSLAGAALGIPRQMQTVLNQAQGGRLTVGIKPNRQLTADVRDLRHAINSLTRAVVFASLVISGALLYLNGDAWPAGVLWALGGVTWLTLLIPRRRRPH